jgi:L-fuculose-phosphate aldolase
MTMNVGELYTSYLEEREELAYLTKRLYERGLTTCSGGNVSIRTAGGHVLITPSALDKARIRCEQIGMLALTGQNLTPHITTSMETSMHLAIYAARADVGAVVHAHPTMATSFTTTKKEICTTLTAEAYLLLGRPVMAPYAMTGTRALADSVAEVIGDCDVVLMENHGIVTVGPTLLKAFDRLEVLEAAANMTLITALLGGHSPITAARLEELDQLKVQKVSPTEQ